MVTQIRGLLSSYSCSMSLGEILCAKLLQSFLTLCDPMDHSPPSSSVHGILQASLLEWVAVPSSRGSSPPRDQTCISCIAARISTTEPSRMPYMGNRWINKHDILFDKRYDARNAPGYCIFSLQLLCYSLSHSCRRMGAVQSLVVSH